MELNSLNGQLYDDFFMQELETRLETDPLMVGGLLDSYTPQDQDFLQSEGCVLYCGEDGGCTTDCFIYW